VGNQYTICTIRRPSTNLTDPEQEALLKDLIGPTRTGFGTPVETDDIRNHVLNVDTIYVVGEPANLEPVGFGSFSHLDLAGAPVLYWCGVVLAEEHQGKGLMGQVLDRAIEESDCEFIATRTQNPIIYAALHQRCVVLYPNGRRAQPPQPFAQIALALAQRLKMEDFDPDTCTEHGTYGGCMTATIPHYEGRSQQAARSFLQIGLNPERGDSAILVGRLR